MAGFEIVANILNGDIVLLKTNGMLQANEFEKLDDQLHAIFNKGYFKLIVDLTTLEYISSAGAGILFDAMAVARERGGKIVFVNPSGVVRTVLDILGEAQDITITPDVATATNLLRT